jgi:adenylate cyclase, class 2
MPRETEIKLPIPDPKSFRRLLKRLGAKIISPGSGRVHEMNLIFDTPDGGLAKHGQLLRIRTETPEPATAKSKKLHSHSILTFKNPPDSPGTSPQQPANPINRRYKIREETELPISDPVALQKIFEGLGLRGWFRYEKFRTTFQLPARLKWAVNLLIELDETPIGTFVELEGPAPAIDRAAAELGFRPADYVLKNYLVLYIEDCRKHNVQPSNMLFPRSS